MGNYFTQEGLDELKKELDYLKNVKEKEIAEALRHAVSFGDLSENAAYHHAKEERNKLLDRMVELEQMLKGAKVAQKQSNGTIGLGCKVLLNCDGEKEAFQIVSPEEASITQNKISCQSPLGKCLIGKTTGEEATVKTEHNCLKYKILKVE